MKKFVITDIHAREILDSRGNPTIETCVTLNNEITGIAAVPSGASTGIYEAHELRDEDITRYNGKGVMLAVANVNGEIKTNLIKQVANNRQDIDEFLIKLDGTKNKSRLGANAILSVSLAVAKAMATACKKELYEYLGNENSVILPVPMCNIINGGEHASNTIDIQEFMIMPVKASSFSEAIRMATEIFHALKSVLKSKGFSTSVGDEGGFAPNLKTAEEALDNICEAIKKAGYKPYEQIMIAIDAAASGWVTKDGNYELPKSKQKFTTDQLVNYWEDLVNKYPIISLEDPLGEDDHEGFKLLTKRLGKKVQIVGDDLFVTNEERLSYGIKNKSANSILIKPNQIGTLSETLNTIKTAQNNNFTTVISHRSGETEDTTIADLAVATNSLQIKTGSLCRTDRVAKYNRLLLIEEQLGENAIYAGLNAFYQINK